MEKGLQILTQEETETKRFRREIRRCENLVKVAEESTKIASELLSSQINQTDERKIEKIIDA